MNIYSGGIGNMFVNENANLNAIEERISDRELKRINKKKVMLFIGVRKTIPNSYTKGK